MKKEQRAQLEFKKIKTQYSQFKQQAAKTKTGGLWHVEAALRGKLRSLELLEGKGVKGFGQLKKDYISLLGEVSQRLLAHYNQKNRTDYRFEEVVAKDYGGYLRSGIISVLVTSHIPQLVAKEYERLLPQNPKDEYPEARKLRRRFILHLGETNTGKTYNALQRLKQSKTGVYLSPLRILALENYERLNSEGVRCSLLTGEEEIVVEGAYHISCTVEKANLRQRYEVAVIDEVQMIADAQRGDAWTKAILGLLCPEIHLCGALNAKQQLVRMLADCGDEVEITEYTRLVPLETEERRVRLSEVGVGDALVAFSKKRVLAFSQYFTEQGIANSVIYGDLPPEVRKLQYDAFISRQNPILISTDAIGMGVNLPIRRIIFTEIRKFDGEQFRLLTSQEVKQIAGRAGRIGIYDVGYVASLEGEIDFLAERLQTEDDPIEQAVVGPGEVLLTIGQLPLKEKLALWSIQAEPLPYYRKKDVRDFILLLERLKPYRLSERVCWRLMQLPFDVHSEELLEQFVDYVEQCFTLKLPELQKPVRQGMTLADYELYYQKINIYYSFSKSLNLPFEEQWVYAERGRVSEKINLLL